MYIFLQEFREEILDCFSTELLEKASMFVKLLEHFVDDFQGKLLERSLHMNGRFFRRTSEGFYLETTVNFLEEF